MSLASTPLPDDPEALRGFAESLQAELARKDIEITARDAEIHAKTLHIEKLKMQLAVLRRARFGRSSEKLDRDIEQLELLIGELEEDAAETDVIAAADPMRNDVAVSPPPRRERRQPVRRALPSHLPRETVLHEPACTCPGCGSTVTWRRSTSSIAPSSTAPATRPSVTWRATRSSTRTRRSRPRCTDTATCSTWTRQGLPADGAVHQLANEIGVPVVAGVLLDHVVVDPAK